MLVHGASAWTNAAPLPCAMRGLQVVSLDNQVISTGEFVIQYAGYNVNYCNIVQEAKKIEEATRVIPPAYQWPSF